MRVLPVIVALTLPAMMAGCDWIGDPWVSGDQYKQDRARAETTRDRLIDRAERGQTDR